MLRRLGQGFAALVTAVFVAACASGGTSRVVSVGPTFASQSLYASNSTQNAVSIFNVGTASGSGPTAQIGGSNTTLSGPEYLAFDQSSDLYVTNYNATSSAGQLIEFKALATGDVLPYGQLPMGKLYPRGIADAKFTFAGSTTPTDVLVMGIVDPTQQLSFASELELVAANDTGTTGILPFMLVGGPLTQMNVPSGVAIDKSNNVYVTNLQGSSVTVYSIPTPSPTPSPTPTPTPTPSPSPTPSGATATPSPTPAPTASPVNIAPIATYTTDIGRPTGIALDAAGNIYVSDQASTVCTPACPAIIVFTAGSNLNPRVISGAATLLYAPTDVKVDSSGVIYVADSTASGAGVIYTFAANATGNTAPTATFKSPGAVIGLALSP